jgi:hypothetical protein
MSEITIRHVPIINKKIGKIALQTRMIMIIIAMRSRAVVRQPENFADFFVDYWSESLDVKRDLSI